MSTKTTYTVHYNTVVDYPERRDASYSPVAPGTIIREARDGLTYSQAVGLYNEIIGGFYDFGSEFVSSIQVNRISFNKPAAATPRCPDTRRERSSSGRIVQAA